MIKVKNDGNILVVEDDEKLNQIICTYLCKNNYQAKGCKNPVETYDLLFTEKYDLIISDIMMPEVNGFDFVKSIRKQNQTLPILFITALDDFPSKAKGFNLGIDDYMVKPLDLDELVLRVGALLRRFQIKNENTLTIGDLTLIRDEMTAYVAGEEIPLLPREFNVLYKFTEPNGKITLISYIRDNQVWVVFQDNGCGIEEDVQKRIFDKFYQGDTSHATEGNGLGLALVKKVLEIVGGEIAVESKCGFGSAFTVKLNI